MKKTPRYHLGIFAILECIAMALLFTPEPYYEIAQKISWYFLILGLGLFGFDMIRSIIYGRQTLSKKRTTETIEDKKMREKKRSNTIVAYGIFGIIFYLILYFTGAIDNL